MIISVLDFEYVAGGILLAFTFLVSFLPYISPCIQTREVQGMYLIAIIDDVLNDKSLDYVGVLPRLFPRLLSRAWKCTKADPCIVPMPGCVTNPGNLISILCFLVHGLKKMHTCMHIISHNSVGNY